MTDKTTSSSRSRKANAPISKENSNTINTANNIEAGESSLVTSILTSGLKQQDNSQRDKSNANQLEQTSERRDDNTQQTTSLSKSPRKNVTTSRPDSQSKSIALSKGKAPEIIGEDYISILSGKPSNALNNHDQVTRKSTSVECEASKSIDLVDEVDLNDSGSVWKHALSLAAEGSIEEATMYFKIHATLSCKSNKKIKDLEDHPSSTLSESNAEVVTEGGITFIPGAITSHTDIGFTPYFDRNLRELKGPIPLTIFNKHWQDLANGYHVEKRVKTDNINKDTTTYTGYPYPHEMTQSYSMWNVNYRNFVTTLRDVYKFKLFASWAEAHQANVEFYHARDNWMTAFRYDIKIRMNAFAFRVSENGKTAPPDISQRRDDVAALCFAESRRLDEGSFTDNPYAKGGARFGFDWTTGLPRSSNNSSSHNINSHSYNQNNSSLNHNNLNSFHSNNGPVNDNQSSNYHQNPHGSTSNNHRRPSNRHENSHHNGRGRSGYNGRNFDPNYAAKKDALAAAKQAQNGNSG
ncbi:uncharacterized protein MELLADRAFT_110281 [Melampsora larici-populina 98AG31]|uniref:Uncharacterized protein n=1 Tax=Melampsora larici-populina (strain 98AG31 / pathotype 3-4-7) TaxID=747676 RepID=F4RZ95_MELLP|nr:uncharacterized protein MELLADRAFT_110281 [Melampsora larici-populina 98AG31]EGG02291.1 hypothetical protein MELLADRAFT_110281 [Melampsora larici-populina 98AG31]